MQTINYELSELERIIMTARDTRPADKIVIEELRSIVTLETSRIRQALTQEVFGFHDERHLERYIQYHQQALIRLLDMVSSQLATELEGSRSVDLDRFLFSALEELLDFVERHFGKYFDQDAKAPEGYIAIARHDAHQHLLTLSSQFELLKVDPSLADIALYALRKLLSLHTTREITYRKIMYVKELQKELFQVVEGAQPESTIDHALLQSIYYLNYNSMRCFTWHTKYLASQLAGAGTHEERIEVLSLLLKNVNQSQVKPGIGYHPKSVPLKEQLAAYIGEEMEYEERLFQLGNFPKRTTGNDQQAFMLKLALPVTHISYIIRIWVEMHVILNKNVNEILRFASTHIAPKRSDSMTFRSAHSKYYDNETSTKEAVKQLLRSMIQYIDKE